MASLPEGLLDEGVWFRVEAAGTASAVRRAAERLADRAGHARAPHRRPVDRRRRGGRQPGQARRPGRAAGAPGARRRAGRRRDGRDRQRARAWPTSRTRSATGTPPPARSASGSARSCARRAGPTCTPYPGKGTVLAAQVWPAAAPRAGLGGRADPADDRRAGQRRRLRRPRGRRPPPGAGLRRARARPAGRAPPRTRRYACSPTPRPRRPPRWSRRCTARSATPAAPRSPSPSWTRTPALVRYAGLGNISGTVLGPDGSRRGMVSLPGIAGHQRRQIREYDYPIAARRGRADAHRRRGGPVEPGRLSRAC